MFVGPRDDDGGRVNEVSDVDGDNSSERVDMLWLSMEVSKVVLLAVAAGELDVVMLLLVEG